MTNDPPPPAGDESPKWDTPIANSEKLEKMADPYRDQLEAMQAELIAHRHRLWRPPQNRAFYATITGYNPDDGTPYAWREVFNQAGTFVPFTSGLAAGATDVGAAIELNGETFVASGTVVRMWGTGDVDQMNFAFSVSGGAPASAGATMVYLTKVGGTDGDGFTPASWVYDAFTDAAKTNQVLSGAAPMAPRVLASENTPADIGLYQVLEGSPTLVHAFESYPMDTCN